MTSNRLARETSPYLLQHATNPVNWFAWGDEAFAEAKLTDRPVFISIGYSACHWCHVMAHESFEDVSTAALLNESFIAIKVDREERPDVDAIYMEAVHALGERGGWPLTAFTTPDGRPFFGGTYFPKTRSGQLPAFTDVLKAISTAWTERRDSIDEQANELTEAIAVRLAPPTPGDDDRPGADLLISRSVSRFAEMFDAEFGGVSGAPKFPQGPMLELLLHAHYLGDTRALPMVTKSLEAMAAGGIYDHLGGGFSRYSVDRYWLVPHFEKMLYDQATLARLYLHAWQITQDPRWLQVTTEIIEYVLRDLRESNGGLFSAEDADSEGEEGLFYTWTKEEVAAALGGGDTQIAFDWYGDLERPNFEHGRSILFRPIGEDLVRPSEVERVRERLFTTRATRVRPGLDDKVITEWNAMFASMLCEAAGATGNSKWRTCAIEIAQFIERELFRTDGRLLRSYKAGRAQHLAMATDYAWVVDLFTRLNELTGVARYLETATKFAQEMIDLFGTNDGAWYLNGSDDEGLVVRPIDSYDGVTPAAGSIATSALARLGAITGNEQFIDRAKCGIDATTVGLIASPIAFAHLVGAAASVDHGAMEIVLGPGLEGLAGPVLRRFLPESVLAWGERTTSPLWEGRDDARAFVCRGGICLQPATDVHELDQEIDRAISLR